MNPRSTSKPCPCGSGLIGLRNLNMDCMSYVACPKCYVQPEQKTYRQRQDDHANRQAAARRRIEAMRDERAAREGSA